MLNEIRNNAFKRIAQTITYIPHFISLIVVCGLVADFTKTDGVVNQIISLLGGEKTNLLMRKDMFRTVYIASGLWQNLGWNSIIYLSALSSIDNALYEASYIDGAGRWKQMIHITLPGIAPTIVILFILKLGGVLNVGFEKIILLYNPMTYETADVISSYVYRKGLLEANYSYGTAVGLFNSIINFVLVITANRISKKVTNISLW
jgi:putative aldouronate transport system permease protein